MQQCRLHEACPDDELPAGVLPDLAAPSAPGPLDPHAPLEQSGAADRTHELVTERILVVIPLRHIRVGRPSHRKDLLAPPELRPRDDRRMMILDVVAGHLGGVILDRLVGDVAFTNGLLQQDVTAVPFVHEHDPHRTHRPFFAIFRRGDALFLEVAHDLRDGSPMLIQREDLPHDGGLLRHDEITSILIALIAVELRPPRPSLLIAFPDAPSRVQRDRTALLLRERGEDRQEHLRKCCPGVDMVVLKDQMDAHLVEVPDIGQTLQRVPGEPRDALRDDQVYPSCLTVRDHFQELPALCNARPRQALIGVDPRELPPRLTLDHVRVGLDLVLEAGPLLIGVRGHTAVGSDPQRSCALPARVVRREDDLFNVHSKLLSNRHDGSLSLRPSPIIAQSGRYIKSFFVDIS